MCCPSAAIIYLCFFFQAEDGIRDGHVTGVQTCALPILVNQSGNFVRAMAAGQERNSDIYLSAMGGNLASVSPARPNGDGSISRRRGIRGRPRAVGVGPLGEGDAPCT